MGCGKRQWAKKHSCKFCEALFAKLPRHLVSVHSIEPQVAQALVYPINSDERRKRWELLCKLLCKDFPHNLQVLKNKKGLLLTKYRPSMENIDAIHYQPFEYCKGIYFKTDIWKHRARCHFKEYSPSGERKKITKFNQLMLPPDQSANSTFFCEVTGSMTNDEVGHAVRNDHLILQFGLVRGSG